jgi:hypothetical protein
MENKSDINNLLPMAEIRTVVLFTCWAARKAFDCAEQAPSPASLATVTLAERWATDPDSDISIDDLDDAEDRLTSNEAPALFAVRAAQAGHKAYQARWAVEAYPFHAAEYLLQTGVVDAHAVDAQLAQMIGDAEASRALGKLDWGTDKRICMTLRKMGYQQKAVLDKDTKSPVWSWTKDIDISDL